MIIVLLLARRRTSFRVRVLLQDLLMQTIQEISSRARATAHRLSLTSFVSLSLTVLRHRLRRRMIALQICRDSFPRLIFLLLRRHRTPLSRRDSLTKSMRCITDSILAPCPLLRSSDAPRFFSAIRIPDADAVAVTSDRRR